VRLDDVPEQDLALDAELGHDAWTIVALASAGPVPVSCRGEWNARDARTR
jgi:hypothetical protein